MQTQHDHLSPRLLWVLAGLTIAWGFNWTAMKVSLAEVSPGLFAACASARARRAVRRAARKRTAAGRAARAVAATGVAALFNITSWNILVAYGVSMIPSGRAAILAYTMPVWAIPLSMLVLGEKITARRAAGLVMVWPEWPCCSSKIFATLRAAPLGSLLVLSAAFFWGWAPCCRSAIQWPCRSGPTLPGSC